MTLGKSLETQHEKKDCKSISPHVLNIRTRSERGKHAEGLQELKNAEETVQSIDFQLVRMCENPKISASLPESELNWISLTGVS